MSIKFMFRVLSLSAHCLCEQGYDVSGLLEIVRFIEQKAGVNAESVLKSILETAEFHKDWNRREKQKARNEEKEVKLIQKKESKFNLLPIQAREQLIKENGGKYWNAVEAYSTRRKEL